MKKPWLRSRQVILRHRCLFWGIGPDPVFQLTAYIRREQRNLAGVSPFAV